MTTYLLHRQYMRQNRCHPLIYVVAADINPQCVQCSAAETENCMGVTTQSYFLFCFLHSSLLHSHCIGMPLQVHHSHGTLAMLKWELHWPYTNTILHSRHFRLHCILLWNYTLEYRTCSACFDEAEIAMGFVMLLTS